MTDETTSAVDTAAVAKSEDPAQAHGVDDELVVRLVAQARAAGVQLTRRRRAAAAADQTRAGVRAGGRDRRSPGL
jgi:hypothetical protein